MYTSFIFVKASLRGKTKKKTHLVQLGINAFNKLSLLHSEVQPKLLQRELRTPTWGFCPV